MLSDDIIAFYNQEIVGAAPYKLHNIPNQVAIMIFDSFPDQVTENNIKFGNNLWNYCRDVLIKQGHEDPVLKKDGFASIVKEINVELKKKKEL